MINLVKPGVYSVGAVDWDVRSFHGYTTDFGASYNAYLILDKKNVLIDTCKAPFSETLIQNIRSIIDPEKIDFIICNHIEPDHSGSLPAVVAACKNAKVLASAPSGAKTIRMHYGDISVTDVKNGDTLDIGSRTLKFLTTPMVHWPDNMLTYDERDGILFSNDAFGEHFATSKIFDVDNDMAIVLREAKKYYANIVLPYLIQAGKAVDAAQGLVFDTLAPSHGIVWTKQHIPDILALYRDFASGKKDGKAAVVYSTMWHSTEKMAHAIADGFTQAGIQSTLYNLDFNHISDIMTDLSSADYLAVGSPTLNNNLMPSVAGFLTYVRGLAPKGLKGFAFGSYGWSGQSIGQVEEMMKAAGVSILCPPVKVQFVPDSVATASLTDMVAKLLTSKS